MSRYNFTEANAAARYYGNADSGQYDPRAQRTVEERGGFSGEKAQAHPYYETLKDLGLSDQVIALQCARWNGEVRTLQVEVGASSGVVYESYQTGRK